MIALTQSNCCALCNAGEMEDWRWPGLQVCARCGHVSKSSNGVNNDFAGIQEIYFDGEFVAADDVFTRLYERLNSKRRLRDLRKFLTHGKTLEVGVGRGKLLLELRKAGYEVRGLDTSEAICNALQSRYDLPISCDTLEEYAEKTREGSFDAIIMCHVLEHMKSPSDTLKVARRLLNESGILYIAVPNVSSWDARLAGWTGYEPYHLHYFRAATLKGLLESQSFAILSERTFEPVSGWFNAVTRSTVHTVPNVEVSQDRSFARSSKGPVWILYNLTRFGTGLLTSPLRWTQSLVGRGEELVMIARAN